MVVPWGGCGRRNPAFGGAEGDAGLCLTGAMADILVRDNPEQRRYEAVVDGVVAGYEDYRIVGDRIIFLHTIVDEAFQGRGIASVVIRGALDDVRARGGLRVVPKCFVVAAFVAKRPEYADVVAADTDAGPAEPEA